MALFFPGKTNCIICNEVILRTKDAICFPAFLPNGHRLHRFSDGAFHIDCFQKWPDRESFEIIYKKYREIWENKPRNLKTLKEIEDWGKKAFGDLFDSI